MLKRYVRTENDMPDLAEAYNECFDFNRRNLKSENCGTHFRNGGGIFGGKGMS